MGIPAVILGASVWTLLGGALAGGAVACAALLPLLFRIRRDHQEVTRRGEAIRRELSALIERVEIEASMASEGIMVHRDGRVVAVNDVLVRMFGIPREAMIDRPFAEFVKGPYGAALLQLSGRDFYDIEFPDASGQLRPYEISARDVDLQGRPARAIVVRHVGEAQRARDALRRNEAGFRGMIERMPIGVALHTEGIVRYANPAMMNTLGFVRLEEVVGKSVLSFVVAEDRALVADRMRALVEDRPVETARVRFIAADGNLVPVETTPVRVIEFEGMPCNLVLVQDITERLALETQLQLTDRMVSLGTMAAGVAHEVNNPLAYVLGNLELVREALAALGPGPDAAEMKRLEGMLDDALEGADRVRRIVLDLKTFSRPDDEPAAAVDVHTVLETAIRMSWNEIRHRARLQRSFGAVPRIEANESRLAQVFLNLLVNAAQAIPEGDADENTIEVSTRTDDHGRVVVEIRDTGLGMTPDVLKRIFDPFFTTKPIGEGTGLGLSIVHGIVTAMGGELTVDSTPGEGSAFRVHLPSLDVAESVRRRASQPVDDAPAAVPASAPGRILCVDDEPAILEMLQQALSEHEVMCVPSGRLALAACLAQDWDLVLCDVMMGDLSGIDVWEAVHAARPELASRFVFLTGGAFTPRAREFLASIDNPRLDKPFRLDAVKRIVAERLPLLRARQAAQAGLR